MKSANLGTKEVQVKNENRMVSETPRLFGDVWAPDNITPLIFYVTIYFQHLPGTLAARDWSPWNQSVLLFMLPCG